MALNIPTSYRQVKNEIETQLRNSKRCSQFAKNSQRVKLIL